MNETQMPKRQGSKKTKPQASRNPAEKQDETVLNEKTLGEITGGLQPKADTFAFNPS